MFFGLDAKVVGLEGRDDAGLTMEAAPAWSYDLFLSDAEQGFLFPGLVAQRIPLREAIRT